MEVLLAKNGVTIQQRTLMAQCFFGGAYGAASILHKAVNEAETPDEFVGAIKGIFAELIEVEREGVPLTQPEKKLILMPGQE
jgi:hypothetical protein